MKTSNLRHSSMSRDQVLVAHAAEMIARTSFSQDRFAQALAAQLVVLVPERARDASVPDFDALTEAGDATAFLRASGSWLKRVQRWLAGEVDVPAWLEEGWVLALGPEYGERCLNELAARHGLVGARAASAADVCGVTSFGQLVACLGHVVAIGSQVLADGEINASDLENLPDLIDQLLGVESRACELRRRAENELATLTGPVRLRSIS